MPTCSLTGEEDSVLKGILTRRINVRSKNGVLRIDSAEFFVFWTEFHLECLYASANTKKIKKHE